MEKYYPNNVKLFSFEKLINSKEETFFEICDFFNIFEDIRFERNLIQKATEFSNKDNLKKIEKIIGHSLANDRHRDGSHMQEYGRKSYKDYLSDRDLINIETIFNEFGYSLEDFENL